MVSEVLFGDICGVGRGLGIAYSGLRLGGNLTDAWGLDAAPS